MNKFKKWLIHLCGGLTEEEADEKYYEKIKAGPHYYLQKTEMPIITFKKTMKYGKIDLMLSKMQRVFWKMLKI